MKIFGTTEILGRLNATTGSFGKYGLQSAAITPEFVVAGTDSKIKKFSKSNRSIVGHGVYDYMIFSNNSGDVFNVSVPDVKSSVIGVKTQHIGKNTVYSLSTELNHSYDEPKSNLLITKDGGATFNLINQFKDLVAFDMEWIDENVGYVAGAIFQTGSVSESKRWIKYRSTNAFKITTIFDGASSIGITSSTGSLLKTEDGGLTYGSPITYAGLEDDCITAIAINPSDSNEILVGTENGKVHKTLDGGTTWAETLSLGVCINRIRYSIHNTSIVYLCTESPNGVAYASGYVWKSTNNGDDWSNKKFVLSGGTQIIYNGGIFDIGVLANNVVIVIGADSERILKSNNGGDSWTVINSNIRDLIKPIKSIKNLSFNENGAFYAAINDEIFYYYMYPLNPANRGTDARDPFDRKRQWAFQKFSEQIIDFDIVSHNNSTKPSLNSAFILTKADAVGSTSYAVYVFQHMGMGVDQTLSNPAVFTCTGTPTKIWAKSATEFYILTTDSEIIKATKADEDLNSIITFTYDDSNLSSVELYTMGGTSTKAYAAGKDGTVVYNTYIDDQWTQTTTSPTTIGYSNENVIKIQVLSDNTVLALTQASDGLTHLYLTADGGDSWNKLAYDGEDTILTNSIIDFSAHDASNIFALLGDGTSLISTDDGFSTTTIYSDFLISVASTFTIDLKNSENAPPSFIFLSAGRYGIDTFSLLKNLKSKIGPYELSVNMGSYVLLGFAGGDGYPCWIGGGVTANARGGRADIGDLGAEPLLLRSDDNGQSWSNYTTNIFPSEPISTSESGGDFAITSISEGQYTIEDKNDIFNIYRATPSVDRFESVNSNLFNENFEYSNIQNDGINKIRFHSSTNGWAVGNIKPINEDSIFYGDGNENPLVGKLAFTEDGGQSWNIYGWPAIPDPLEYDDIRSVFPSDVMTEGVSYKLFIGAVKKQPDDTYKSGIFELTGGTSDVYRFYTLSLDTTPYQIGDIFFVNPSTGSVIFYDNTSGGVYNTINGGNNWTPVTITNGRFGKYSTIQYVTQKTGFLSGKNLSNPALYKTKDSGQTWTRITTPADVESGISMTGVHFFDEKTGVVAAQYKIYKTSDSGSSWSLVHTIDSPDADPSLKPTVTELKFSADKKLGIAVGFRPVDTSDIGEHFVLKSVDEGSTWNEVDIDHIEVDLEYGRPIPPEQGSALFTVAFKETLTIPDENTEVDPPVDPPVDEPADCFQTKFISSSYYNFENFAYKCTIDGKYPIYHPNNSNNIGLGKGIFGQNTAIPKTILKNTIVYGAALGVDVLGNSRESTGDTAIGFGAMDNIDKSSKNVAVGYKALSLGESTPAKVGSIINSNITAVYDDGTLFKSEDGGNSWQTIVLDPSSSIVPTSSFNQPSSSLKTNKTIALTRNTSLLLANDVDINTNEKYNTYISITEESNRSTNVIFTSSLYTFTHLYAYNPNIVYAIDSNQPTICISYNGGLSWASGSVAESSGNSINALSVFDTNNVIAVGDNIWLLESGSTDTWITSSYSGSHVLYAASHLDSKSVIAVGASGSVYTSVDYGENWDFVDTNTIYNDFKTISIQNGKILIGGESGSIIVSNDNGTTWQTGSFDLPLSSFNISGIEKSGDSILAIGDGGALVSNDNGNSWTLASIPSTPFNDSKVVGITTTTYESIDDFRNEILNELKGEKIQKQLVGENVAVGNEAISNTANSWKMVGIGSQALKNSISNRTTLLNNGEYVGSDLLDLTDNGNATSSALYASNYGQVAIGAHSQQYSNETAFNTSIGYATLHISPYSNENTAIGFYSQHLNTNDRNTSIGAWSLGINGIYGIIPRTANSFLYEKSYNGGMDNIAIGYKSMMVNMTSLRYSHAIESRQFVNSNLFGTKNIAIGNYALTNVSGSSNVISIGYKTLSEKATDITDSVFIGNFAGSAYQTITGSYESGSGNTDWLPTKAVVIGNNAAQNQTGIDLVVVGANALRGNLSSITDPTENVDDVSDVTTNYGVIFTALADGNFGDIYYTADLDNPFRGLFGENGIEGGHRGWTAPVIEPSMPTTNRFPYKNYYNVVDFYQYNENVVYALCIENVASLNNVNTYKPFLIKTTNLKSAISGQKVRFQRIQHKNKKGEITSYISNENDFGTLRTYNVAGLDALTVGKVAVVSDTTVYVLRGGIFGGLEASYDGGITFESVLAFNPQTGDNPIYTTMHFETELSGKLIGHLTDKIFKPNGQTFNGITNAPLMSETTDGGTTWNHVRLDDDNTFVEINSAWFNSDHSVGYAVGNYGTIYKYNGSTWTKKIGGSISESIKNESWNTYNIDQISFGQVFFISDTTGYVLGHGTLNGASRTIFAKTTDGGDTWDFSDPDDFKAYCTTSDLQNGNFREFYPRSMAVIDENRIILGGYIGYSILTNDGGVTWHTTRDIWYSAGRIGCSFICDPLDVQPLAYFNIIDKETVNRSLDTLKYSSGSVVVGSDAQQGLTGVAYNVAVGNKVQYESTGSALYSVQIGAMNTYTASKVVDSVSVGNESLYKTDFSSKITAIGGKTLYQFIDKEVGSRYPAGTTPGGTTREWQGYACIDKIIASPFISTCNTVVGFQAGKTHLVGPGNVFIGCDAGRGPKFQNELTYGQNNIIIGTNARKSEQDISNEIGIGNPDHTAAWLWGQHVAPNPWRVISDSRDKADTGSFSLGLDLIRRIQPKSFRWDIRANYVSGSTPDGTFKSLSDSYGYIAQEIESASIELGYSGSLMVNTITGSYVSESGYYEQKAIIPGMLDLVAINAIKELDQLLTYISSSTYAQNLGDGINSSFTVTHSLNTRDIIAMVHSNVSENIIYPSMSIDTPNTIVVSFDTVPSTNEYRLVVKR